MIKVLKGGFPSIWELDRQCLLRDGMDMPVIGPFSGRSPLADHGYGTVFMQACHSQTYLTRLAVHRKPVTDHCSKL
ncbi:hypothetical protein P3L10_007095 [Capsicum annuum]